MVSGPRDSITIRDGFIRDVNVAAVMAEAGRNIRCERISVQDCPRGISVGAGSLVSDCQVTGGGLGIFAGDGCDLQGNTCRSNSVAGLGVAGNGGRIVGNLLVDGAGIGLAITGTDNYVADNRVKGNADNYEIMAGNKLNLLLCELPETIDWPTMVRVAGTLTGTSGSAGITINASDVTIDLDGHALVGGPGTLEGIDVPVDQHNIEIRNGTIRGWGRSGVDASYADNSALIGLRAMIAK